jgi:hypothetical protein
MMRKSVLHSNAISILETQSQFLQPIKRLTNSSAVAFLYIVCVQTDFWKYSEIECLIYKTVTTCQEDFKSNL